MCRYRALKRMQLRRTPVQVFFAIFLLAFAIANAQAAFPDLGKAKAAVQNIFSMLDRVPLIDSEKPGAHLLNKGGHFLPCRGL